MKKKMNKSAILKFILFFLILIIMICIALLIMNEKHDEKIKEVDNISLNAYFNNKVVMQEKGDKEKNIIPYMSVIEIPKINLKQGIPEFNSENNNVERNIMAIKESVTPDVSNGAFILASHSGNSSTSYFKNLHKLSIDDEIFIYYKGVKYIYTLSNFYDIDKTGYMDVVRDNTKSTLILITCKKETDKQTIFVNYLKNKEDIKVGDVK